MQQNKLYRTLGIVFIWLAFVFFPFFLLPKAISILYENSFHRAMYLLISVLTIVLYYFNYYYAIPKFFITKRYVWYVISLLLFSFIMFAIVKYFRFTFFLYFESQPVVSRGTLGVSHLFRSTIIISVSFTVYYLRRFKEMETEKVKAELQVLRAQINPHFFFNTLNIIYGQAVKKSDQTADSIAKLASIMRYAFANTNEQTMSLSEEIDYIQNYIGLQKMRLTEKTTVTFSVQGNVAAQPVPALLFVSIIENAFKYGVSTEVETCIDIDIKLDDGFLTFVVKNDIPHAEIGLVSSSNIGMENTKKRLDLLYKGLYSLEIDNQKHQYTLTLKIKMPC